MPLETSVELSDRLRALLDAWVHLDPATVSGAYLDEGTHRGPGVARLAPDQPDATLHGRREISAFVERIAPLLGRLTYRVSWVLESESVSVVEYEYESANGPAGLATDVVEWENGQVSACRTYGLAP